ncbi:hypothetical protein, partial [Pseudomarimonas arenosa]|uniref:hypothetical protein n=1 Tax=Pseudomarimonas arenosa TaxID=2774145 RepID=UPI001CDD625C
LRSNGYFVACAFATLGRLLRSNGYFVACAFATLGRLLRSYAGLRPDLAQVGPPLGLVAPCTRRKVLGDHPHPLMKYPG